MSDGGATGRLGAQSDEASPAPTHTFEGRPSEGRSLARLLLKARSDVARFLDGKLFADPAFDILLELHASEEEGRRVQITNCAVAANIPPTTSYRWIAILEARGLIERHPDRLDGRRVYLTLSADCRAKLTAYLARVSAYLVPSATAG